ncbi:unnamed protein product [Peniophora sp. CBMAI 1063]|nr:unnamed protein product [Peniophora sp. CBMAI 1063]
MNFPDPAPEDVILPGAAVVQPPQDQEPLKLDDFIALCRRAGVVAPDASLALDECFIFKHRPDYQSIIGEWGALIGHRPYDDVSDTSDPIATESNGVNRIWSWDHRKQTLEFVCEHWRSENSDVAPSLEKKQVIHTNETSTSWNLYAKPATHGQVHLSARPTLFNDDGTLLRIGAQLFSLEAERTYQPLASGKADLCEHPSYFEEFARRGAFVAIASRAHTAAQNVYDDFKTFDGFGATLLRLESLALDEYDETDDESESESDPDEFSVTSSESDGRESWSEGSTDVDDMLESDFDSDSASVDSSSSSSADAQSVKTPVDEPQIDAPSRPDTPEVDETGIEPDAKSIPDDESRPPSVILAPPDHGLGRRGIYRSRRPPRAYVIERGSAREREPEVLLTVFGIHNAGPPTKLFQYKHPLSHMIYESPPALHPHKTLAVWPLGSGSILFADFVEKTYHVQQLRPSTSFSRNVSMKVHFSPCGQYLHVAALEARPESGEEPNPRHRSRSSSIGLRIYLLLSTFRLSSRKTARSPPPLVHRAIANLGKHIKLNVLRLPFTFVWTETDLFVTQRGTTLSVQRLALFGASQSTTPKSPEAHVLVPKNTIILPVSASTRDVHFMPSDGDNCTVIIGSDPRMDASSLAIAPGTRGMLSPPIGAYLHAKDLGGWIGSEAVPIPNGQGVGKLAERREFYFIEGCNIEPWIEAR